MAEVRKTVRLSKEDFDYIMAQSDLETYHNWNRSDKTFSERFRNLIAFYKNEKVRQHREASDNRAQKSDKTDIRSQTE